jgi:hypothetical protein
MPVEVLTFATAADWEAWLAEHHTRPDGVWLKIAKRNSGETTVTISEALDVALCYGWIDSQRKPLNAAYYLQRYSRRTARSPWSRINAARVTALIDAGRMREPGLAAIEAAKTSGRFPETINQSTSVTTALLPGSPCAISTTRLFVPACSAAEMSRSSCSFALKCSSRYWRPLTSTPSLRNPGAPLVNLSTCSEPATSPNLVTVGRSLLTASCTTVGSQVSVEPAVLVTWNVTEDRCVGSTLVAVATAGSLLPGGKCGN